MAAKRSVHQALKALASLSTEGVFEPRGWSEAGAFDARFFFAWIGARLEVRPGNFERLCPWIKRFPVCLSRRRVTLCDGRRFGFSHASNPDLEDIARQRLCVFQGSAFGHAGIHGSRNGSAPIREGTGRRKLASRIATRFLLTS